ncbi:MAG: tetratricopeptide repeat protein [Myxococcales bacterium]|nr:tetratricopeptide repeat protein [Myxococcales bacterium]
MLFGFASNSIADTNRDVNTWLQRYKSAWESRNPFELIALTPPGSTVFVPLLTTERFDQIRKSDINITNVVVRQDSANQIIFVTFQKDQEDLFHVGTVTRGIAQIQVTLRQNGANLVLVDHREVQDDTDDAYLSTDPTTWSRGRPEGERLFYLAYQLILQGEFANGQQLLLHMLSLPQGQSQLNEVRYRLGNEHFFSQIHYFLGLCEDKLGREAEALRQMKLALSVNPSMPLALNYLADTEARHSDPVRAIEFWQQSLQVAPEQPSIRARKEFMEAALAHYPDGELRELFLATRSLSPAAAAQALTELLSIDRKNPETRRRLAVAQLLNHDPDSAEKTLLENRLLHPDDLETEYLLGRTYLAQRRYEESLTSLTRVWNRAPAYRDVIVYLTEINSLQGRYRNAVGFLREALHQRPNDAMLLYKLGVYSLKLGHRFEATALLRQARAATPPVTIRQSLYDLSLEY